MNDSFSDRLAYVQRLRHSVVCVGIDPDPARIPAHLGSDLSVSIPAFCRDIIRATSEFASSYKFNFAFFEALGSAGHDIMAECLAAVDETAVTIADAKRGDIGNSAGFYAKSVFDDLGFHSVTVSPYMGRDSVTPFLSRSGTCAFVLARTSNPGGDDLQQLSDGTRPLYEAVASLAGSWANDEPGEAGLVVGATDLDAMKRLRAIGPDVPFLVPGVGAQGGSARDVLTASGSGPILVNSSRAILYASSGRDFASAAEAATRALARELEEARS